MFRAALTGPAGVFWWLGVVLAFVLGSRWQLVQDRQQVRDETARLKADGEARVRDLTDRHGRG